MPAVLSVPVSTTALSTATSGMQQAFATTARREVTSSAVLANLVTYLRTNKPMTASTLAVAAIFVYALRDRPAAADAIEKRLNKEEQRSDEDNKRAARVDRVFFRRLTHLLAIAVPSPLSRESLYLAVLALVLAIRTYLSIRITTVNGEIVKAIVQRNFVAFLSRLAMLASIAIPASIVNSLLKYLRGQIALCLRSRLVHYFHQRYLSSHMFYSVLQLDSRIAHPDQALTETLDKWSVSCSQLYSDITKPTLDIVLFAWKISDVIGPLGPIAVVTYYFLCGLIIQTISPRFGRMTAQTQRLEGAFRTAHHRLITSSEEIAFYQGQQREQEIINNKFSDVLVNQSEFFRKQLSMGVLDGFLTKYGAVLLGYSVLGLPVFGPTASQYTQEVGGDTAQITRDYVRNSGLLINFSQAIGRIVTSYKELQKLAGFTSLVTELEDVLGDLEEGRYERTMLDSGRAAGYAPGAGVVSVNEDCIAFDDAPIITPNGDLLVDHVSFRVARGENLMIVGPNGCGKSSLFRILGGLWPLWGGRVERPSPSHLFYIPQKPYLCAGTLRDNLIYPHTVDEMAQNHKSDADLVALLASVQLSYLLDRPGGWEAEEEWADVLSGGEKQRVAMARLFYHEPYFAILDECTSAVSVDVEGYLYRHAREQGITLITISHRQTLWQYHEWMLRFVDEEGGSTHGGKGENSKAKRKVTFRKMVNGQ